jgi:hypothetical protein
MRLLIVGAGASYAECKAKGLPHELCMPLMKDLSMALIQSGFFMIWSKGLRG